MFCNKCGKELKDGAKFCNGCGNKITPKAAAAAKTKKADPVVKEEEKTKKMPAAETQVMEPAAEETFANTPAAEPTTPEPAAPATQAAEAGAKSSGASSTSKVYVGLIVAICVLVVAIIAVVIFMFTSNGNPFSNQQQTSIQQNDNSKDQGTLPSDFIFADSDCRYLSESELQYKSLWDLYIARNEIYARHGRDFKKQDLRDYFGAKSWYHVKYSPAEFDANTGTLLNDFERKNAELIRKIEQSKNSPYLAP